MIDINLEDTTVIDPREYDPADFLAPTDRFQSDRGDRTP